MAELDLEGLRRLVEEGERRRAAYIAAEGLAQADWISDDRLHYTTFTGDLGVPLTTGRAIVDALERAERVEAALMRCAEMSCVNPVEYVPWHDSVVWRDCHKCPTCNARAILIQAPSKEGRDG